MFTSGCNQRVQKAQVNNRSDEDYGNLSDVHSHKVADPVNTSCSFSENVNGNLGLMLGSTKRLPVSSAYYITNYFLCQNTEIVYYHHHRPRRPRLFRRLQRPTKTCTLSYLPPERGPIATKTPQSR